MYSMEVGSLLLETFCGPAKCSLLPQVIVCDSGLLASTGLPPWPSALGGKSYPPKGLGNRAEQSHSLEPHETAPGGNTADTCPGLADGDKGGTGHSLAWLN